MAQIHYQNQSPQQWDAAPQMEFQPIYGNLPPTGPAPQQQYQFAPPSQMAQLSQQASPLQQAPPSQQIPQFNSGIQRSVSSTQAQHLQSGRAEILRIASAPESGGYKSSTAKTSGTNVPLQMKAARLAQFGGPDVLTVTTCPVPVLKAGEALVGVHAAALNPQDFRLRSGHLRNHLGQSDLPVVLGTDVAGVVVKLGPGAPPRHIEAGDVVFGLASYKRGGSYGEYAVCKTHHLERQPLPPSGPMCCEELAALPTAALTAYHSLKCLGEIKQGERVLVCGGASGVGAIAIQLAKNVFGASHIASTGAAASLDFLRQQGAMEVVAPKQCPNLQTWIQTQKPDVVVDTIGAPDLYQMCEAVLPKTSRFVTTVGKLQKDGDQAVQSRADSIKSGIRRVASGVGAKLKTSLPYHVSDHVDCRDLPIIRRLVEEGLIRPVVDRVFNLEEVGPAHTYLEAGLLHRTVAHRGKIVLRVAAEGHSHV